MKGKKIMNHVYRLDEGEHHFLVSGQVSVYVDHWGVSVVTRPGTQCAKRDFYSQRYTCTCDPSLMDNERERYARQVILELPEGREKARRISEGLSPEVCVDPCIVDIIKDLWSKGIETLGCCCGHNVWPGHVDVHPDHHARMLDMGYKKRPVNEHGHGAWSFLL
jgi:hypothetical protein